MRVYRITLYISSASLYGYLPHSHPTFVLQRKDPGLNATVPQRKTGLTGASAALPDLVLQRKTAGSGASRGMAGECSRKSRLEVEPAPFRQVQKAVPRRRITVPEHKRPRTGT